MFALLCFTLGVAVALVVGLVWVILRFAGMIDAVHLLMMRELERCDPSEAAREREILEKLNGGK